MRLLRLFFGLLYVLMPLLASAASPESFIFTHYGSNIGMPAVIVYDIAQTGEGTIWLATYSGLYAYDGKHLRNFKAENSKDVALQSKNRYVQLESDVHSNLWVLSESNTLFYYRQSLGSFEQLALDVEHIHKINSSEFYFVTKDNHIYKSAYLPDGTPLLREFLTLPEETEVNGILVSEGFVWTLTSDGLYRDDRIISAAKVFCHEAYGDDLYFGSDNGKVLQYQDGKIRMIDTFCHDDVTFLMVLDNKVDVIIGTKSAKLYCIDTGTWELSEVKGSYYSPTGNFKSLRIDGDRYIFSESGGFYHYNQQDNSLIPFYDSSTYRVWDTEVTIHDVFADKQNNIWLSGSSGGMSKAVKKINGFHQHVIVKDAERYSQNSVNALYQDDAGYIYAATRDGKVHVLDSNKHKIAEWEVGSYVTSICRSSDGTMYLTTIRDGIIVNSAKDPKDYEPRRYEASRAFYAPTSNEFLCAEASDSSRIWFATRDESLCYLEVATGQFISKKNRLTFPTEEVNCIRHLAYGPDGRLYASGTLGMFVCSNPKDAPENMRFERFEYVKDYDINHILITAAGRVYGSSLGGGFLEFESGEVDSEVRAYTVDDGMLSDNVLSAIEDEQGIIWIATTGGLNKFNPNTGSITPYTRQEISLRAFFNTRCPVALDNGDLCFPARGGIFYFNSREIQTSRYVPEILIRSCDVSGVETQVNVGQPLRIKAGSSINLRFYAIDQSAPTRIFYYYKMDGLDDEWQRLGLDGEIQIDRMPRGNYTLRLRSTNGDGVSVNNELSIEIKSFSIFWLFVNIVYVILFISAIILGIRYLHLKKGKKNPEDEKFKAALITFLDENIDNAELSSQDIASAMNISRSALFDKAGNILGKAPMELLRERRLNKAAELLKGQEYTVSQIAYMCGFNDSHYFSKVFKKHYGLSPSTYRKQLFTQL